MLSFFLKQKIFVFLFKSSFELLLDEHMNQNQSTELFHQYQIPKRVGNYQIYYPVGKGGYSIVFQGKNVKTQETVALKFVKRENLKDICFLENFEKELRIYQRLNHKGITKFIETLYLPDYIVIVQELLVGGTLSHLFCPHNGYIKDDVILRWGKEILETIAYLHKNGISHNDIKPDNIGLDSYYHAKILDFGLCSDQLRTKAHKCGTPFYAAPEIFSNADHDDFKADIWSYGVTMHVIVTGQFPFIADDINSFRRDFKNPNFIQNRCTGALGQLIDMCLKINPNERMTAHQILNTHVFDRAEKLIENFQTNLPLSTNRSKSVWKKPVKQATIIVPHSKTFSNRIRSSFSV